MKTDTLCTLFWGYCEHICVFGAGRSVRQFTLTLTSHTWFTMSPPPPYTLPPSPLPPSPTNRTCYALWCCCCCACPMPRWGGGGGGRGKGEGRITGCVCVGGSPQTALSPKLFSPQPLTAKLHIIAAPCSPPFPPFPPHSLVPPLHTHHLVPPPPPAPLRWPACCWGWRLCMTCSGCSCQPHCSGSR